MKAARFLILFASIFSLLTDGCEKKQIAKNQVDPNAPKIKVAVFADGRITADGNPTTIEELRQKFQKLAEQKGSVWYYREAGQAEPPAQAMQVIKEVVAARLPIRLSSQPDYSDAIGFDGKPIQ
jgi:biopolymer transport protein ExbD